MIDKNFHSIPQAFFHFAKLNPDAVLFEQPDNSSKEHSIKSYSFSQIAASVSRLANFLQANGVVHGSTVAIISNTRYEWIVADLAILACGAVSVSVYQSLPGSEIGYILFDSAAEHVFVENQEQLDKLLWLRAHPCKIAATEDRAEELQQLKFKSIITFEPVDNHQGVTSFNQIISDYSAEFSPLALNSLKGDSLACIVYSSGTTGPAKGVLQTHANHLANVRQAKNAGMYQETSSIYLILPLAHSFAKLMAYIGVLAGVRIKFALISNRHSSAVDPKVIARCMKESCATIVPIVPRLLEKIKEGIESKARAKSVVGRLIRLTLWAALERHRLQKENLAIPNRVSLAYEMTAKIRSKLSTEVFGSYFQYAISGGAKLPLVVSIFFEAIGIEVLEGYGLTETCVATNVNRRYKNVLGSVGPVLDEDIEIKINSDGEILFRGPNITRAYHNRPTATKSSYSDDGWFYTGDLGQLDESGYLFITGRKKDLIVTSGGKKIVPDKIEQELKKSNFISQAVLCGEGRQYCVVLVTPNLETIKNWASQNRYNLAQDLSEDLAVQELIKQDIDRINSGLASYETIKRFALINEEFSIDNGLLTPTLKIKRNAIFERYKGLINSLYM